MTAANSAGSASATSAQTATVAAAPSPPVNTASPVISGTTTVGSTLTATDGTWSGTPTPTYTRQWQRCDTTCADIAGATGASYVLVSADAGQKLQVVVTAANSAGSASATSAQTATVAAAPSPPVNTAPPVISGTTTVGSTLTTTDGTWSGTPTLTRRWQRCTTTCANITGATGATYVLVSADAGRQLQVVVTATNSAGTATATSAKTATITQVPVNTAAPVISGTTTVGSRLTTTNGTWSGSPTPTYTRQWQRCATTCADIAGATGMTYLLVAADAGQKLQVVVTATNSAGSASATSAQTATINGSPPVNTASPVISGTTTVGSTLTTTNGTWSGSPTPTYTRQWQRCATTCADIAGATGTTYVLVAADAGQKLQVVVTATNSAGSASATSAQTATISGSPPVNTAAPVISGTTTVGSTLTTTNGTWSGSPAPTYARQWQRCNAGCANISGATGTTYVLVAADAGQKLQVMVTATNSAGSASATSAQTTTILPAPGGDPTIAAAGDIACDPLSSNFNGGAGKNGACAQRAVSDLIYGQGFSAVLALGDNQYYCGGLSDFQQSYDLSWGRLLPITHPVVGNHEYVTSGGTGCDASGGASGYFAYYGSRAGTAGQGYYSYDVGSWHLIALNSNCSNAGGCSPSSPQGKWLAADLAAHKTACTLAYWHIPLFSSGGRAATNSQSFWTALYNAGADLILNGHDHIYERFAPQTPAAAADNVRGLREFIVGTGGANHTSLTPTTAANSELRNETTYGILKLTLHANSYDWQFVRAAGTGTFTDSGTQACH